MYHFFQSLTFLKKKKLFMGVQGSVQSLILGNPTPLFQDSEPPLAVVNTPKYRTYTYHT